MGISRAEVRAIREEDRRAVLAEFGIVNREPLAVGTEAEVYVSDEETLLKLYVGHERFAYLQTLQRFYESIDDSASPLRLPRLLEVKQRGRLVAVLETRLTGVTLETALHGVNAGAQEHLETLYLDAVSALTALKITQPPQCYLLFEQSRQSAISKQSFEAFYADLLAQKVVTVSTLFATVDSTFAEKAAELVAAIRHSAPAPLQVVHGDFFPGNVLVTADYQQVVGVIDFGSFTLFGNHLLDWAGAFGFYQMYAPERGQIRDRLLSRILDRLTQAEAKPFFQFLLANAILTSDLYVTGANPLDDGHFAWAVELVNEASYWHNALS